MLSVESQQLIEKLIIEAGVVPKEDLGSMKLQAIQQGKPLLSFIYDQKLIDEEQQTKILAKASGTPYADLRELSADEDILNLLPKEVAKNYMAVPFGRMKGKLAVAMLDASNVQAIDYLSRKTGQSLMTYMASRSSIEHLLKQYKANVSADVSEAVRHVEGREVTEEQSAKDVQNLVQDAPITRALNAIIDYAIQARASDIHIEPKEKELRIRARVDGILQETMNLPKSLEPALVSRIKILSNLKIDEHRVPQDGQFQIRSGGREVDARVAISPVVHGEQVVIRLLDKSGSMLTLKSLGLKGRSFRLLTEGIRKPHGMVLSTGPTGSGKTTTLYALIQELNDDTVNIVTLEDPVEYRIGGINQIQVNPGVGLTFANGLRSVLRQDPNIIMVGEIRDRETADLAVQSALTGHIVLSSLHTNSASGVLPRMLDMKIEPFLLASTINTVIGQRLVRRICENCKQEIKANEAQVQSISKVLTGVLPKSQDEAAARAKELGYDNLPLAGQSAYTLYKSEGCDECNNGFRGRIGIYEVFAMNGEVEALLVRHATTAEVQEQAIKDGMITMKQDGYLKALNGITTIEEVARVAADM